MVVVIVASALFLFLLLLVLCKVEFMSRSECVVYIVEACGRVAAEASKYRIEELLSKALRLPMPHHEFHEFFLFPVRGRNNRQLQLGKDGIAVKYVASYILGTK